eukprot:6212443-Pleurochrysis_carterae.AAC.1
MVVAGCLSRRYQDGEEGLLLVEGEGGHQARPGDEAARRDRGAGVVVRLVAGVCTDAVVKHRGCLGHGQCVKLDARFLLEVAAERPDGGEDKPVLGLRQRVRIGLGGVEAVRGGVGGLEQLEEAGEKIGVGRRRTLLALLAHKREERWQVRAHKLVHLLDEIGQPARQLVLAPRLDEGLVADVDRLHVDHAAARDGGGRGDGEVVHLEHHVHPRRELDALAVREAEHLVVVEHRVHVFDPERVHRAVEDDPVEVVALVVHGEAHERGHETVGPLLRHRVDLAVELTHCNGFWIQRVPLDNLVLGRLLAVTLQLRESGRESLVASRLAGEREAHHHHAVAHQHRLEELDDLGHMGRHRLHAQLAHLKLHRLLQTAVVYVRDGGAGEEVLDDGHEERHVLVEELWQVGVTQRADEGDVLADVGVGALELPGHDEHALDGAHAKVVVVLLGQLLRRELVELRHLVGQALGLAKALRKEHNLGDEAVVGHHHGHGAEERLEVVGQLGAAGVARVHRDEDAVVGVERNLAALEEEPLRLHLARLLDGQNLLRNHREHLNVDPVELVEASPRAALRQA